MNTYNFSVQDSTANEIAAASTNTDTMSIGSSSLAGLSDGSYAPLAPAFLGHSANELINLLSQQEPRAGDTAVGASGLAGLSESAYTPHSPAFLGHSASELMNLLSQQEPRAGDTAPTELEDRMLNFHINGPETAFDDIDPSLHSYFMGSRTESVASSSRSNQWTDGSGSRATDAMLNFDFLVKSVSAANNYVSMLTREQLTVLRSLRPSLLFEFLHEVAKVRSEKRMRRALPNECAFCKNNGENEECYTTHALKDGRGRVLCPVLRAFRCPRCGATGDRAHTIKYCPESNEGAHSRRRPLPSTSLYLGATAPASAHAAPPPSPAANLPHANPWANV